jgi:uncharacterized membrane protein YbhN (UPF0104 family)
MKSRTKITKTYNLLIQFGILVLTCLFIYRQVFIRTDLPDVFRILKEVLSSPGVPLLLLLVLLMMGLNWALETWKWSLLIRKIEPLRFLKALEGVLSGVTISSFTPNRVGEFFGRAYILDRASHVEGILVTILGSMSQLLVTFLAGSISFILLMPRFLPEIFHGFLFHLLTTLVLLVDILLLLLYFQASSLARMRKRLFRKSLKRARRFFRVFGMFTRKELLHVLGLSIFRYLVFSTQFFLLLRVFHVPVSWPDAMLVISFIYLVMTLIPTVALTELGIRGSVSVYCFGLWFHSCGMPADSFHFGVPAVAGTFFVFRLQFFRKNDTLTE